MTESLALELVENYLTDHNFGPKRIDVKKLTIGKKAPDFEESPELVQADALVEPIEVKVTDSFDMAVAE
jgi:hypothetical protein